MSDVLILNDKKNILGEGPFYDERLNLTSWVDIVGKKLSILDWDNNLKEIYFNEKISAAIPTKDFGYLVCGATKLYLYKNNEIKEYMDISHIMDKGMRCNDAKADLYGRLWFSSMMDDGIHEAKGALYCLDSGILKLMQDNIKLGNGLVWNKDNTKFYFVDSVLHKVYVYDYDLINGEIKNRKVLCEIDGIPDGISMDMEENLYIAIWGGKRIEVHSSITGEIIRIIPMPVKVISSCTFGGNDYKDLIITSASIDDDAKDSGKVFSLKMDIKGKKEYYFDDCK